ncbi:MAG: hypothetical protein MUO23_07450 [Anaerolineales bacterium]|nr:hypothetical protein [Anaerolineales bacterium]
MKKAEPGKMKSPRSGSVVVAGWCAILAVPLILARITLLLMNGQLAAVAANAPIQPAGWLSTQGVSTLAYVLVVPIAVLSLVSGIGILNRKRWAWVALVLFLVLALFLNLFRAYFAKPEYGLMLVYAALALILNQTEVRRAFRIGRPSHEPVE